MALSVSVKTQVPACAYEYIPACGKVDACELCMRAWTFSCISLKVWMCVHMLMPVCVCMFIQVHLCADSSVVYVGTLVLVGVCVQSRVLVLTHLREKLRRVWRQACVHRCSGHGVGEGVCLGMCMNLSGCVDSQVGRHQHGSREEFRMASCCQQSPSHSTLCTVA